jgi:hypothetical protein
MSNILIAMSIVLGAWVVFFCALSGWGHLGRKALGVDGQILESWITSFWLGFAIILVALQLWHLILPVDWKVDFALITVGLAGFVRRLGSLDKRSILNRQNVVSLIALAPLVLWVANLSLDAPRNYDSGLYYFNAVRWANEYPIVVGLGNLHGRLAFNQSYFLYVAMLNISPFFNEGHHLASGLLAVVLLAQIVSSMIHLFYDPIQSNPSHLFQALFLRVAVSQALAYHVSSPSPDSAIFILGFVLIVQFIDYLLLRPHSHDSRDKDTVFLILILALVGVSIKLSFIMFSLSIVTLTLIIWFARHRKRPKIAVQKSALWLLFGTCIIGLPWMLRGILTSGYIAYPSTLGALPVDWRVPLTQVHDLANWIRSWARQPKVHWSIVLSSWDWFVPWLKQMVSERSVVFPLCLAVVGVVLSLMFLLTIGGKQRDQPVIWLPFLPPLFSLVFWFISAPAPRFAGSAFWVLGLWAMTVPLNHMRKYQPRWVVYAVLFLSISGTAELIAKNPYFIRQTDSDGFCPIPKVAMEEFRTDSGLVVYVPASGEQSWDSKLPSTPHPDPKLELRGENIKDGFRLRVPQ